MRKTALALFAVLGLAAGAHAADPYPGRPVRMIVAVPPGGPADTLARLVAPRLTDALGQTVVIDNRPGANGIIAYELAARATPDGYTFVLVAAGVAINPSLYREVRYDPIADFAAITHGISVPNILVVHPSVAARSAPELVALARSQQGRFTFASAGNGTCRRRRTSSIRAATTFIPSSRPRGSSPSAACAPPTSSASSAACRRAKRP